MKPHLLAFVVCGSSLATAAGQVRSAASNGKTFTGNCSAPNAGQTAWFDPCVYLLRSNSIQMPKPLQTADPEYSEFARQNKISGTVVLAVAVNASGTVDALKVVRSLEPTLDQDAAEAIRKWRFVAATYRGKSVPVQIEVSVDFRTY